MTVTVDFYARWRRYVVRSAETGRILHSSEGRFMFPAAFTSPDIAEEWAHDHGFRVA